MRNVDVRRARGCPGPAAAGSRYCPREAEPAASRRALRELCRATLERNRREGERDGIAYGYTAPSSERYPCRWYWDSCFSAIACAGSMRVGPGPSWRACWRPRRPTGASGTRSWINAAWLLWLGLIRLGYEREAADPGTRIRRAVAGAGLRE